MKTNPLRIIWIMLGTISMALGCIGVILPVLPTIPFLLLASFCLARGSKRFHGWFMGTRLYKKHLDSFVRNRSMTLKTKMMILLPVSVILFIAFLMMDNVVGRTAIIFVFFFKYYYFLKHIRTIPVELEEAND